MNNYISKSHIPDIEGNMFAYNRRLAPKEQIELRVELAIFTGVFRGEQLTKLDEGIYRAFLIEKNPEYTSLFKEGNPELREAVALAYYQYGFTQGHKRVIEYFKNLDPSKDESLAIQFINQIDNMTIRSNIKDWINKREEVAKYLMPTGKIELVEQTNKQKEELEREKLDSIYAKYVPTLNEPFRERQIREPPKPDFIKQEQERIDKSQIDKPNKRIIREAAKQEQEVFGEIKLPVPTEITDILGENVIGKNPEELQELLQDIEEVRERYITNKSYVEWLDKKYDEAYERFKKIKVSEVIVEADREVIVEADREEMDLKKGKEILTSRPKFIRQEQERVFKSPILPEEELIAEEIEKLENKINKESPWTTSIPEELIGSSYSREFSFSDKRIVEEYGELKYTDKIFEGLNIPYRLRTIRNGNRIEQYAFFDIKDAPFEEAIKQGKITQEEANLIVSISIIERDVGTLTMEYLDELALSIQYEKQGKVNLAKEHKKEAESILRDAKSRAEELKLQKQKYAEITGNKNESPQITETKEESLHPPLQIVLGPIIPPTILIKGKNGEDTEMSIAQYKEELITPKETPSKTPITSNNPLEEIQVPQNERPYNPWQDFLDSNQQYSAPSVTSLPKPSSTKQDISTNTNKKNELIERLNKASSDEEREKILKELEEFVREEGNEVQY